MGISRFVLERGFTMKELFKELLGKFDEGDGSEFVLNMIYAGCISADTLLTKKDCKESRDTLMVLKEAVDEADVGVVTKKMWNERISFGLSIIDRDEKELS